MVAAIDKSKAAGAKRDATIESRQRRKRVATIVTSVQQQRWMMAFDRQCAMVFDGDDDGTARRQRDDCKN